MTNQIFGIIIISFIVLAAIFLVFSKKFRKSVFHHTMDWMAKKVSRVIILIIALIIIVLVVGFFGNPK